MFKSSGDKYRIVVSASPFWFEAHGGLFRLLMKEKFDAYVLWPFDQKLFFELVKRVNIHNFTVIELEKLVNNGGGH